MSLWSNDNRRTILDDAEDFGHAPSGGRTKQWFAGVLLSSLPMGYGIRSILLGRTFLPGKCGGEVFDGPGGMSLAVAYIALGCFIHFHYFWGLSERLERYSQALKVISLLAFVPCFGYAIYTLILW
jgi:hypothetical protein